MKDSSIVEKKPITELANDEDKVKAFIALRDKAYSAAQESIRQSEYNRKFFGGDHFTIRNPDGSIEPLPVHEWNRHSARTQGSDIFETIQSLVPLYVRNKPDIQVVAEDENQFVDLRTLNQESGDLEGGWSDLFQAQAAESMTDIYNNLLKREMEIVQHAMIILEAMVSGVCYVTFKFKKSAERGMQVEPKILRRENFLADPEGTDWWDFDDYRYMIIRSYMTPAEIKMEFGVDEAEYATQGTPVASMMGYVSKWLKNDGDSEQYGLTRYPVDVLFYSHYLPLIGYMGEDHKPDVPIPKQYVFINESYLAKEMNIPFAHQNFPVTSFMANPVPWKQDGIADISQLIGTQIAINMLQNAMIDSARLMGNPGMIADERARPKGGWNFNPGGVTYTPAGTMGMFKERTTNGNNTGAFNVAQMLKQNIRASVGDEGGLLQGATPASVKSGRHANVILNSLLTRHALTTTMFDASWYRLHRQRLLTMQQVADFDTPYWRKQTDISEVLGWTDAIRNLRFDLKLESKSDLPFSPQERIQYVIMLWDKGIVDLKYVLKILDLNIGAELEHVIKESSNPDEFIPGVPGYEQAIMKAQLKAQGQAMQQGGQPPQLGAGQQQLGAGGGQQQQQTQFTALQGGNNADFPSNLG